MADLRITYDELMVGAGHPTLGDTLNRHANVEHNSDGTHKKLTKVTDPWIDVRAYGAVMDGTTDDSAAFASAFAAGSVVMASGSTAGNIVLPSDVTLIANGLTINGTLDCTNAYRSTVTGFLHILPPTGSSYGMKLRRTRWCKFGHIIIGPSTTPKLDGIGLLLEGAVNNGTYYNTFEHMTIHYMNGLGCKMATDTGDTIFRVGSNKFGHLIIHYCDGGGLQLKGAANNEFNGVTLEQCLGTVLDIDIDGSAVSYGNKLYGLYMENPSATTDLNYNASCTGTLFHFTNDQVAIPNALKTSNAGSVWHGRGAFSVFSSIHAYGAFRQYQTTDAYERTQISGAQIYFGDGTATPADNFGRQGAGIVGTDNATDLRAGDGTWNGSHLMMGAYHLWVDATGDLRIKSSAPTSDTDGTVVGTQL